jgi:polysaccharide export outer membrane protein
MHLRFYMPIVCLLQAVALSPTRCLAQGPDNLPTQPIGIHDLISVSVYGASEFSRTVRISPAGEIWLPMLKRPVHAEGLLPVQLELAVAKALEQDKLLVKPSVTVTIAEYRSRSITVVGAVHKPVTFQQLGTVTLTEALVRAEGLLPDATDEVLVVRAAASNEEHSPRVVERFSAKQLFAAEPTQDVRLHAGDEVRVAVAEKIFVVGSVRRPGAFRAEDVDNTTVMSMLALSEGLLPYAANTAYVYRKSAEGRKEISVDLKNILQRKASDVRLQTGDVLYIPDNKGRRLTMSTIDRIVGFGAGTASGMLIWRR